MSVLTRNNVHVQGKGPPMVFVHGFGCDQNMWRLLAPHFAESYQVHPAGPGGQRQLRPAAYDRRSTHPARPRRRPVRGAGRGDHRACHLRRPFGQRHDRHAGQRQVPDAFAAQVMVGPSPCYINDGDYVGGFERSDIESLLETLESNYLGWSSNMAPAIMGAPDQPQLAVELTNSFCRTDPEIAKHFARVTFLSDHRADLPKLQAPTLVLQCSDDLIAPMTVGQYLSRAIPNCTLRIIENVGHCPHLSAPSASAHAIEEFLATL
jgi:sigma-B regulation protein RsbQ